MNSIAEALHPTLMVWEPMKFWSKIRLHWRIIWEPWFRIMKSSKSWEFKETWFGNRLMTPKQYSSRQAKMMRRSSDRVNSTSSTLWRWRSFWSSTCCRSIRWWPSRKNLVKNVKRTGKIWLCWKTKMCTFKSGLMTWKRTLFVRRPSYRITRKVWSSSRGRPTNCGWRTRGSWWRSSRWRSALV